MARLHFCAERPVSKEVEAIGIKYTDIDPSKHIRPQIDAFIEKQGARGQAKLAAKSITVEQVMRTIAINKQLGNDEHVEWQPRRLRLEHIEEWRPAPPKRAQAPRRPKVRVQRASPEQPHRQQAQIAEVPSHSSSASSSTSSSEPSSPNSEGAQSNEVELEQASPTQLQDDDDYVGNNDYVGNDESEYAFADEAFSDGASEREEKQAGFHFSDSDN